MGLGDRYRDRVDRRLSRIEAGEVPVRVPLTAGQHILHLLLTVLTAGLWTPVWITRAARGNKTSLDAARARGTRYRPPI